VVVVSSGSEARVVVVWLAAGPWLWVFALKEMIPEYQDGL
jgi:hypothetical protein